jgi:predicted HicB family RNase H-like nuclease
MANKIIYENAVRANIRLSGEDYAKSRKQADIAGISWNQWIVKLIQEKMKKRGK